MWLALPFQCPGGTWCSVESLVRSESDKSSLNQTHNKAELNDFIKSDYFSSINIHYKVLIYNSNYNYATLL